LRGDPNTPVAEHPNLVGRGRRKGRTGQDGRKREGGREGGKEGKKEGRKEEKGRTDGRTEGNMKVTCQ
jgi:hypothetical protein